MPEVGRGRATKIEREKYGKKKKGIQSEWTENTLVQTGLLHDTEELVFVDLTITIAIGLFNHLHQFFVGHVLSNLLGHTTKVAEGNLASLIIIEETEGLEDFLTRIALALLSLKRRKMKFVLGYVINSSRGTKRNRRGEVLKS